MSFASPTRQTQAQQTCLVTLDYASPKTIDAHQSASQIEHMNRPKPTRPEQIDAMLEDIRALRRMLVPDTLTEVAEWEREFGPYRTPSERVTIARDWRVSSEFRTARSIMRFHGSRMTGLSAVGLMRRWLRGSGRGAGLFLFSGQLMTTSVSASRSQFAARLHDLRTPSLRNRRDV